MEKQCQPKWRHGHFDFMIASNWVFCRAAFLGYSRPTRIRLHASPISKTKSNKRPFQNTQTRVAMSNTAPFESPRTFYSKARDLMVNGIDLIEELSEVTVEPSTQSPHATNINKSDKISYFGSPGAFAEHAARKLYPTAELLPNESWGGTIEDLLTDKSDRALIPMENFITNRTRILYDLICKYDLHIIDEAFLKVEHALLTKPEATKEDIKVIMSHIQALFQCELYVVRNFPSAKLERAVDTAVAARTVAASPTNEIAAIASASCAKKYGLKVLQDRIQDREDNVTRFVVLGKHAEAPDPSVASKTSILFALPEDKGSGSLGRALQIFADHKINLVWLDSRELRSKAEGSVQPWNYLFYINLEGSTKDKDVGEALDELKSICLFFRIIGSYKMEARYLEDYTPTVGM